MKVTINWLKDYLDFDLSPYEVSEILTMLGIEVEGVEFVTPSFEKVVVSEILNIRPHPNADRLKLCEVFDGTSKRNIVCGAPNIFEGAKAALVLPGGKLPNGIVVEKRKVRGVLSEGMLCSEKELEIGEDESGIMVLEKDIKTGTSLDDALNLSDYVLELSVTPNRPDCLSVIGVAREFGLKLRKRVKLPEFELVEIDERADDVIDIEIEDPVDCPRYCARVVSNVKIKNSPFWMRYRLSLVGIRPINNVVDVTNYVMMEYGQPLHAFDYLKIGDRKIVVRRGRENETIQTLDGVERGVSREELLICDAKKPIAVAGVMGGQNSEVTDSTETILIESAMFCPQIVRKSARSLGLSTEASLRFEKGVDPEGVVLAIDRAAYLISQICGGSILKGIVDRYPDPKEKVKTKFRSRFSKRVLGVDVKKNELLDVFKLMDIEVLEEREKDGFELDLLIPSYRRDIKSEIDLVEEVARISGYEKIPNTLPTTRVRKVFLDEIDICIERLRSYLLGMGFYETISYSFVSPKLCEMLGLSKDLLFIKNPLREDQSVMRPSLLPSVIETFSLNLRRGGKSARIFEIGNVFKNKDKDCLPEERVHLCVLMFGKFGSKIWDPTFVDFFDMKGCVENILDVLDLLDVRFSRIESLAFHPKKSLQITSDKHSFGVFGELNPIIARKLGLPRGVFLMEMDLETAINLSPKTKRISDISKFPEVARDIAIVVDDRFEVGTLVEIIKEFNPPYLKDVEIFDIFSGKPLPLGKKSVGIRVIYQALNKTLKEEEVKEIHKKVALYLVEKTGGSLR